MATDLRQLHFPEIDSGSVGVSTTHEDLTTAGCSGMPLLVAIYRLEIQKGGL